MKLSDFILLNETEKKTTVLHHGILIAKRKSYDCQVFLFQIGNYYVEMFCDMERKSVEEFRIFDGIKPLSPYLDAIPIDDLIN